MANFNIKKVKDSALQAVDKGISEINKTVKSIDVSETIGTIKENADKSIKVVSSFASNSKETLTNKTTEFIEASKKKKEIKRSEKKKSIDELLQEAINNYNSTYDVMNASGIELHYQRERSIDVIEFIENLINSIANRPKSFEKDFEEIASRKQTFKSADDFMKKDLATAKKQAVGAGAGVAAGVGVVTLAPAGAMWVATTFGTASTGTAIASLSGAAATNAALAWLGGGALTAGGGGMVAGQALLTLAGPIGWGIAGASILTSVVLFANNKMKRSKEKEKEIGSIKRNTASIRKTIGEIDALKEKTEVLRTNLTKQYQNCINLYGIDYQSATEEQKKTLGALVNNTKGLSQLVTETISTENRDGE